MQEYLKQIREKKALLLFLIYFFSNVFFVLNNSFYWDDWCWTGNTISSFVNYNKMLGGFGANGIISFVVYNYPLPCRIFFFFLFIISVYLIYNICISLKFSPSFAWALSALILLYPHPMKFSLSIVAVYLFFFEFILASFLLLNRKQIIYRILSLILFFHSFCLNSLLVFYAVPIGLLFYKNYKEKKNNFSFLQFLWFFIKENICFLSIPFVFFLIKLFFYPVSGIYAEQDYNFINNYNIKKIVTSVWLQFKNIIAYIYNLNLQKGAFVAFSFLFVIYLIYYKKYHCLFFYFTIFLIFIFAVLPYSMVGKTGTFKNILNSRFLFLTSIPISLFVILLDDNLFKINKALFGITIFIFFSLTFENGIHFFEHKIIQDSFIETIKTNKNIINNNIFTFSDRRRGIGVKDLNFDFYMLSGLFWKAFDSQEKFGIRVPETYINSYKYKKNHTRMTESTFLNYYKIKDALPYKYKDIPFQNPTCHINMFVEKGKFTKKLLIKALVFNLF